MADLLLDTTTGDLDLTSGGLELVDGADAVAQHLRIRLRTVLGSWFLDTRIGVPYFERILVKNPDTNLVRRILNEAIVDTPGVSEVRDFNLDYDGATRIATVTFVAVTDLGETLEFTDQLIIRV